MIILYNTLTRQKEKFIPLKRGYIGFYACGPTVYWFAHIGNLRSYLFEDILRRSLEYNGYAVKHVMNFTDVGHLTSDQDSGEDKIEQGAQRENKSAREIADFYIDAFKKDATALNIKKPTIYARATDYIQEQIELIKILEKKGFTYITDDGVYFDTSQLPNYGQLAKLDLAGLRAGARVEAVGGKKHLTDFALWKFTPGGIKRQQEWDSPWAPLNSQKKIKGFPGWHLECSAMAKVLLGKKFDIHGGGVDHIPVHHTNEIAQSQVAFGEIPANYWLHNEFLMVGGEKMSKSLGNLFTLADLKEKGFSPLSFRYLTLTAHYRSKLNLTWGSLEGAQNALTRLYNIFEKISQSAKKESIIKSIWRFFDKKSAATRQQIKKYRQDFLAAVNDDLDTPKALGLVWQLIDDPQIESRQKKQLLLDFDKVFGLNLDKIKSIEIPDEIKKLAAEREQYRQEKNWPKSDELRAEIEKLGWLVEDTPPGPKLKPKR